MKDKRIGLPHSNRSIFVFAALGAGLMTGIVIWLLFADLYEKRDDVVEETMRSLEYKSRLMLDHAGRSFEAIDLVLFGLAKDMGRAGTLPSRADILPRLRERMLFLPQALSIAVYDGKGELLVDSGSLDARENVADQPFFAHHRDEGTLFQLEGPVPRRFDSTGREALRLSRLILAKDGRFMGALMAEIDPAYFRNYYREEDPLGNDEVTLLDSSLTVMSAETSDKVPPGKNLKELGLFPQANLLPVDVGKPKRLSSGERLAVIARSPGMPFYILVTGERQQALAGWRLSQRNTGLIVSGVVAAYLGALGLIGLLLYRRAAAERALRLSEEYLRAIHDNADIGILRADDQGVISSANPAFARMLGTEPEALVGLSVSEITHPDDVAAGKTKLLELSQGLYDRYTLVKRYRRLNDGGTVWARISVMTVKCDSAPSKMTFGLVEDITESKRSKETIEALLKRSQSLLNAVGEGILGIDAAGRVAFVNPASESVLGYAQLEMIGRSSHDLIHTGPGETAAHKQEACPIYAVLSDGKPRQVAQDVFWRKDGTQIPVEYVATPMMSSSGIEGAVIAFRDISRRVTADTEIKRSNAELEQFAYAVSHDLQEPLRMVASYVQLLGRRYQGKLDKDADEFIHFAVDGAKRMQQMITDILEYSRVQRKGSPMAPVAIAEPLRAALQNLELSIVESKAKIEIAADLPTLRVDAAQISRLFQNLIGNAVKYRDPARALTVRIGVAREGGFFKFSVADNGIGIDPQYFERIFQIFQRLHARTDYPGTGVGLAICRKIVERHGGNIWLESEPGAGSTFFFSLPAD
jgi:PAS domain S-box-containing protein